ncbi:MAG: hypothetical protein WDN03_19235 [Rhizomicrobium sp.]
MRLIGIGLAAAMLAAAPAAAGGIPSLPGSLHTYAPAELGGGAVPVVARGAQFAVACDSIQAGSADVSVVMSLANAPGDTPTGYSAVLATDQTIVQHSVSVLIPDVPDFANHTVDVKVYVTDTTGTHACDAGRVRIV